MNLILLQTSKLFTWIIGVGAAFRLLFVPFMGLMPQGAYYSFYAENLDWSYYDHPPMIAYFLATSFLLLGKKVWVVKLMTWATSMMTLWVLYKLGERVYSKEISKKAAAIWTTTVMASILALVATPDVPLLLFWGLTLWCAHKAIFDESSIHWLLTGVCMGMAFDSKYTAVFLPACLLLFLLLSKDQRRWLLTPWPYASVVIMALLMLPVFYWNYIHDFASFTYQGATRAQTIADEGWKPEHILGSIAMQSTVLIPVLFVFIFFALVRYWKKWKLDFLNREQDLFLLSFFVPVFGAFMLLSIMYWVKLNWIMPAYLAGILFLAPRMSDKWFRVQWIFSAILHILVAIQVLGYVVPVQSDDTWWGWEQLAEEVQERQAQFSDAFLFAGDHYKTTAQLGFHIDDDVYAHNVIGSHSVHYDMVMDTFLHLNGRDAIYIDSDPRMKGGSLSQKRIKQLETYFQKVEALPNIELEKNGRIMRSFQVWHCENYTWIPGLYRESEK